MNRAEIIQLLGATGPDAERLRQQADAERHRSVGDTVYLRGIIEFSNNCVNNCLYCGIRRDATVARYRMPLEEILSTAAIAQQWQCGTIVLQSGDDPVYTVEQLADIVRRIKEQFGLAVTLSIGVRPRDELVRLKKAGCDRYLLRFETAHETGFSRIHPDESFSQRVACLNDLRDLGYQVGTGFMIGINGPSLEYIADDLLFTASLSPDMIGCGPFLAHPQTPLAAWPRLGQCNVYYNAIALLRLMNPYAHIPATTAFDALESGGREKVLISGANIFMPNITPAKYRYQYQLYPNKPAIDEEGEESIRRVVERLRKLGRPIGFGAGHAFRFSDGSEGSL